MPQLDTATWTITIMSMLVTLFIVFQLKTQTHQFPTNPQTTQPKQIKQTTPWEKKWTKIYSPLS
uniref:ATP synthase complex subunit 8 n=1 Tax=Euryzygomatomys spinosus TaxID=43325 RepID=A0A1S5S6B1_EURSP|nr:ATP synthase F0 subunit 8 [Euryzygomatomys spinosus]